MKIKFDEDDQRAGYKMKSLEEDNAVKVIPIDDSLFFDGYKLYMEFTVKLPIYSLDSDTIVFG